MTLSLLLSCHCYHIAIVVMIVMIAVAIIIVIVSFVCSPAFLPTGKSPKDAKHFSYLQWTEHEGAFHLQPRVHWYDARARTALKEMATWLRYG